MLSPIFLKIGPLSIRWYGVCATLALIFSYLYLKLITPMLLAKNRLTALNISDQTAAKIKTNLMDIVFWTVIAGVLGARLYHVINELPYYLGHPTEIIAFWHGGLAIHGGIIAGALVLWFYARKNQISWWLLVDMLMPALLLTLAIARFGNYFNQELFRRPTDLPWGIFIDPINRPVAFANFTHFHPTFLYESLWNFLTVIGLTLWIKKKPPRVSGIIFAVALTFGSLGRLLVEFLRIDQVPIILGIRLPLMVSGALVISGICIWLWLSGQAKNSHPI